MEEQLESWNILAHLGTSWFWSIFSHVSLVQSCSHLQSSHLKESHIIALLPCTRGFFTSSSLRWVVSWSVSSWEPREKNPHRCGLPCGLPWLPCDVTMWPAGPPGKSWSVPGRWRWNACCSARKPRWSKNVKECQRTWRNWGNCVFFHEMDEIVEIFSDIGCCKTEFIGRFS